MKTTTPNKQPRAAYGQRVSVKLNCLELTRTKQSFKDECNINNIMAKYIRTGTIDFVNKHQAQFGDCRGLDNYQEALNTIQQATETFADMPAALRKRFNNNPGEFLEFVEDPSNREEAVFLGLINKPATPVAAPAPAPATGAPGPVPGPSAV